MVQFLAVTDTFLVHLLIHLLVHLLIQLLIQLLVQLLVVTGTVTDTAVGTVAGRVACTVIVTFSCIITDTIAGTVTGTVAAILININIKPRNFGNAILISCKIAVLCSLWFSLITALYTARLFVSKHNAVESDEVGLIRNGVGSCRWCPLCCP